MIKKKIVLVTYGGGHVNMIVPIAKRLQKIDHVELVVLGLTTAGKVLELNNIPYIGFKDLLRSTDQKAAMWGKKLVGSPNEVKAVSHEESIAYMGLCYRDLELQHGEDEAARLYRSCGGRQAFFPLLVIEKFLREEKPDLLIATNSPRTERAAISVGCKLKIPTICLVDLFAIQEVQWIGMLGYADKICVLSNFVKQTLMNAGRLSDEIVVTGNPVFDNLATYRSQEDKWRRKKGWGKDKKVILWVSQPEPEQHPFVNRKGNPFLPREIDSALIDIMSKHSDWHLIIRPHPNESIKYDELPYNVELSDSAEPLYELLAAIDIVITMSSTVGLEAALMGKPLVSIDLSVFTDDAPYSKMGIAFGVDKLCMLEEAILTTLKGGWKSAIDLPEIGNATDRILSVVNNYL